MNRTRLLALALSSSLFAGAAFAATDDDQFTVSITIDNVCTVSVADMNFNTQTDITSSVTATANGNVDCTGAGPWAVDFSTGGSGGFASRRMANGSNNIQYNLYRNSGHTDVLGDGTTGGTVVLNGTGDNGFTIYGQTVANQTPPTGTYTDTITATVTF